MDTNHHQYPQTLTIPNNHHHHNNNYNNMNTIMSEPTFTTPHATNSLENHHQLGCYNTYQQQNYRPPMPSSPLLPPTQSTTGTVSTSRSPPTLTSSQSRTCFLNTNNNNNTTDLVQQQQFSVPPIPDATTNNLIHYQHHSLEKQNKIIHDSACSHHHSQQPHSLISNHSLLPSQPSTHNSPFHQQKQFQQHTTSSTGTTNIGMMSHRALNPSPIITTNNNSISNNNNNNNMLSSLKGQTQQPSSDFSQNNCSNNNSNQNVKRMIDSITCNMHEMLEFELHLSNSDMRQLYSDGYYNPSLLASSPGVTPNSTTTNSSGNMLQQEGSNPLTRIDYIKCTPNGVLSKHVAVTDSNSSSSSHSPGRASPDNSETQGLTWYENQQVVLHLWVRIKEHALSQFKTVYDDYTSGNLNPSIVAPLKLQILYKNAEFPAKGVLIHEFSLDPIQCYQKYLKNKELERQHNGDKSSTTTTDSLLVYSRNMDFSLERKTVKVVNKRLKVRFEMVALPFTNDQGTMLNTRIALLMSPTIVCLTARSFFFDKRKIKTAKRCGTNSNNVLQLSNNNGSNSGSITPPIQNNPTPYSSSTHSSSSTPTPQPTNNSNTTGGNTSSPIGTITTLRQPSSNTHTTTTPTKSNTHEENTNCANLAQEHVSPVINHHHQHHGYSPYPSTTTSCSTRPTTVVAQQGVSPPPAAQYGHSSSSGQSGYRGNTAFRSDLMLYSSTNNGSTCTSQQLHAQHVSAPPTQTSPFPPTNYRQQYSASSLMLQDGIGGGSNGGGGHNVGYPPPPSLHELVATTSNNNFSANSSFSHVTHSPPPNCSSSAFSSLPSLSSIFNTQPVSPSSGSISQPTTAITVRGEPPPHSTTSRNQFLQLSIPMHSLPREVMDMHDSNEMLLVNDFLEFINAKYRKSTSFR